MSDVFVSHLASSLGSIKQSLEEAEASGFLVSAASALRAAGFSNHHICASDETCYELAENAFLASGIDPQKIDVIIYSTCLPLNGNLGGIEQFAQSRDIKHLMHFPASRLQAELGMGRAFVIGLNQQACTGMLGSLRVARNMLRAEPELANVLCITADRFPEGARYEQAYNLISDGAAVCRVGREPLAFRLLAAHHITNGAMVQASDDQTVGSYFSYVCQLVEETLRRADCSLADIRWIVPQNTNRKAWDILTRLLKVEPDKAYFPSIEDTGHVISADNIINLARLTESELLQTGDRILTFMAGFGSHWQCVILERV